MKDKKRRKLYKKSYDRMQEVIGAIQGVKSDV